MLKKTIKYEDYNGVERTEDFYFNLSKAECMEMNLERVGGLEGWINEVIQTQDQVSLVKLFKEIILKSYGRKSSDGREFIKSEELRKSFEQTEAYSELYMELVNDAEAASAWVKAVLPKSLSTTKA